MDRPTGPGQTKDLFICIPRDEIMAAVGNNYNDSTKTLTDVAVSTLMAVIAKKVASTAAATLVSGAAALITTYSVMDALTSYQKKELTKKMFFEVKDKFVSPCYVHVLKSYRKGSQGYFWVPSNEYHRY